MYEFVDDVVQLDFFKNGILGFTGRILDDWLENVTALLSMVHVTHLVAHKGAELVDKLSLRLVSELEQVATVEDLGHDLDHTDIDVALLHDWLVDFFVHSLWFQSF